MKKKNTNEPKALTPEQQEMITDDLINYADALATGYRHCGVELDDLMQEARYGLCQAVLHFDSGRGVTLKTFATYYIKKYILKAIKDYGTSIAIPREDRQQFKILSLDIELTRGESNIRPDGEPERLDDMEHGRLEEFISEEDRLDIDDGNSPVKDALDNLSPKEREALECLFGLKGTELTVKDTALVLCVKPERVNQLYKKAINKLSLSLGYLAK